MLWIASMIIFAITHLIPPTPMEVFLHSRGLAATPEAVAALQHQWGLDGSAISQYIHWVTGFVRGDCGHSIFVDRPICEQMAAKIPVSLFIGLGGVLLAAILAYPLGCKTALQGGIWDLVSRLLAVISQAVPSFVVAILLIYWVGVRLGWVSFYSLTGTPQLIAPMLIIAFYSWGQLARVVAHHALDVSAQPFVAAEMGRGFDRQTVVITHGRRQILYGLVAACLAKMSWVIGGSSILEFVFAVPGMSAYIIDSIKQRDYQVIQSYLIFLVVWMIAVHLVCDLLLAWLDPRSSR